MLAIKNNIMADTAARHLGRSYDALAQSVERLSSGLRINSAKDDAAGLAVRELMRAEVSVLRQGARNAQDGVSLLQTMEGAMASIDGLLVRMKELAEQAESLRDQLLSATELDVWQAYYDLQSSASSVASASNLVKSATESAAAQAARYKAGIGNLLDFITAQQDDTNARVAQIQSYLDWYTSLARLNFALGASDSSIFKARPK